jgi:hypothetical protein
MWQLTVESERLYQSQWWTRLAAFSEKRESPAPVNVRHTKKKRSGFISKTLAVLLLGFHSNRERGHAPSLPELNI